MFMLYRHGLSDLRLLGVWRYLRRPKKMSIMPSLFLKVKNTMKTKDIHIGSMIEQKVKEKGIKISVFAKAIYCNRSNVYSIFRRKSIDTEQLVLISKVLNFDFIKLYFENESEPVQLQKKYIVVLETDELKIGELEAYKRVKVIECWSVSK